MSINGRAANMRPWAIFLAITILSSVGFSALIDRVLSGPSSPSSEEAYTGNANYTWAKRWAIGTEIADSGDPALPEPETTR